MVHNCHILSNNVLPKRWCLIPVEYLLDNAFLKIFPSPSNLHVQKREILKKDMQYENYNERGFFFVFVSCWFFCRIYYLDLKIYAHPGVFSHLFPAIVTDFNCCHRKIYLGCDRISRPVLIRTTSLSKVASIYPITLGRVSGRLAVCGFFMLVKQRSVKWRWNFKKPTPGYIF